MTNNFDPIELLSYVRYRIYIYRVWESIVCSKDRRERIEKIYTIPINPKITNRLVSNDSLHHRRSNRARNPRKLVPEIALRTNLVFRNTWRGGKERERERKKRNPWKQVTTPSMSLVHGMESVSTIRQEKWESRPPVTSDAFTSVDVYGARN